MKTGNVLRFVPFCVFFLKGGDTFLLCTAEIQTFFVCVYAVLGIKPRAPHMLSNSSTTEPYPNPEIKTLTQDSAT
jgi:hypothetical protein